MSEPIEIRVSASTPFQNLAGSIVAAFGEGKEISLAAIGPAPVAIAVKAVCVANRTLASRGVMLVIIPGLITRTLSDHHRDGAQRPWTITVMRLRNLLDGVKVFHDTPNLESSARGPTEEATVTPEPNGESEGP